MEDISNTQSGYHPRRSYDSPLWKLLNNHYENFERCYEERFEQKYGFFRPIIGEVVRNYLTCGDLKNGFARVRCEGEGEGSPIRRLLSSENNFPQQKIADFLYYRTK